MIGLGITMPVLPFYVERLALAEGATRQSVVIHVGLLTGVYALMQLIFAPLWGCWSDRIGRRPLILIGIAGYVVAQVLFGLATSLWLLYAARIFGGVLSSATLPVSAAYVADMTTQKERSRGMAWLGTAVSLGVVVGVALGGLLSRRDLHFNWSAGHFKADSFSIPFFAAALLGLLTLLAAMRWLPESMPKTSAQDMNPATGTSKKTKADWRTLVKTLSPLLALTLAGQFALTIFEGTFALFAQAKFAFGPAKVGYVFVVCGLVMTVFQAGAVGFLAGRVSEIYQIGAGLGLMGTGIALLATARTTFLVFAFVALLALGMAFIAPNLAALISKRGGEQHAGASLGIQNAANSLGQAGGPLLGGVLFIWQINAPYLFSGAVLLALALAIGWKALDRQSEARLA
jgi:DHA1 family multidrug resistance protein-like MFS transporter